MAWKERFDRKIALTEGFLLLCAAIRLAVVVFSWVCWGQEVPPDGWLLLNHGLLAVLGLGVATVMMVDALRASDRVSRNIAWMIYLGYLSCLPTVVFIQVAPMVGMLMIPKTVTYVAIAVIAYRPFYTARLEADVRLADEVAPSGS